MEPTCSQVLTDWLSVSASPDSSLSSEVVDFLKPLGGTEINSDRKTVIYPSICGVGLDNLACSEARANGTVVINREKHFHGVSMSGKFLAHLRATNLYTELINLIGSHNHRVTRLDVAMDVDVDFPTIRKQFNRKFPNGEIKLTRKAVKIKEFLERRESDNKYTGTIYMGHRTKARVQGKLYDKQKELLDNQGIVTNAKTRLEFTVRSDAKPSLVDALNPAPLFWEYGQHIFDRPSDVSKWAPSSYLSWKREPPMVDYGSRLRKMIEYSDFLDELAELADKTTPNRKNARQFLGSLLSERLLFSRPVLSGSGSVTSGLSSTLADLSETEKD